MDLMAQQAQRSVFRADAAAQQPDSSSQHAVLAEMLQQWASATGERPAMQSWPRRVDSAVAAAASSSSAAAASVDPPRRVLYSSPVAVPAYAHAPVRPVAQADWGAILSSRGEGFTASAVAAAAAAASSSASSAAAAAAPAVSSLSPSSQHDAAALCFPPNMSYDLLLGHATHLFRAAHSLDRALTMRARRDPTLRTTRLAFIDAFGTRLSISVSPWSRVSDAVAQLMQSYIPAHLRSWSQIGIVHPPPRALTPPPSAMPELMDLTDEAEEGATDEHKDSSNSLASSATQSQRAERVQTLSTAMLHQTLVHAELVEPPSLAAAASSSAAAACSSSDDLPSLIAFGNLTVLLRYAPSSSAAAAVAAASSTAAAAASSSAAASVASASAVRTQTLTLQVFGLDCLSSIMRRVSAHALTHFGWRLQHSGAGAKLYALQRSFSLPLALLSSVECGGLANGATLLSDQQSLYAAGLTAPEMLLLVELDSASAELPPASAGALTIKTLTGRQIRMELSSCPAATTVRDLKSMLARKESLPASQQRLLFEGVSLEDPARSLESYGIRSDSTLQLLLQLRSNTSGFNLSAGRPGLHPLSCDSREVATTLSQLMLWTLPPANKQRGMSSEALVSLLLHTRQLLSSIYAAVLAQVLHGHSSRGKAWIDEGALQAECDLQSKAEPEDLDPEPIAEEQPDGTKKRRVLSLGISDDDEEAEEVEKHGAHAAPAAAATGSAPRTRPVRLAPSLIDLTAEAPAAHRVFNSSSPILIDDDEEAEEDSAPVAALAPVATAAVPPAAASSSAAASSFIDPAVLASPPLSPLSPSMQDRTPLLQRRRLDSPLFAPVASPSWSGEEEMPPPLESFHSSSR